MGYSVFYKINTDKDTDYYYDEDMKCLVAQLLSPTSKVETKEKDEAKRYWNQVSTTKYFLLQNHKEYLPVLINKGRIEIWTR